MTTLLKQPTKRIEYIDALRGFTMILVVLLHIEMYSFELSKSFVMYNLFSIFRMPLFFFVSGFISYKANIAWSKQTWWTMSKKKLMIQLLPTLFFGLIYAYTHYHVGFTTFIGHLWKYGYWFTFVLFEMFIILYTLNLLLYNSDSKTFQKRQIVSLILLSIIFLGASVILRKFPNNLGTIFSLVPLGKYFPYFSFGIICSMNKERFHKVFQNKWFTFIIISLFCIGFCLCQQISPKLGGNVIFALYYSIFTFIGFMGLLIVYNFFRVYQNSFVSTKKVGKALQYIGKRTLDIYLIHYFFIPYLPQIRTIISGNNVVLELVIVGGLSLIVIAVCLIVSNILRTSPILAKYLFGAKE
jgi:fucose 4-O-acetylase-like acetyltransferase